ncbi:TOG array regulator of axonemal microtubules protein 2-like isoform X2 [Oenanthe melanoleuca]|uniref:TOG array regulator of axonemal microtubules protein 2-like isoform X2 n=1 Tax=Oenanthe melanoleuca TaxID=2939378 RepID=UPI0024C1A612|nr:TOG array regulator of axonemal microtubules protein 2-like isoform X2 [Oenanthe melanoleuca]
MDFTGKGNTTEGKDLTGYPLAKRFSLANPSVLLPSKPLPPIRKSFPTAGPSKICSGEQDSGKNGTGYDDNSRKEQELDSEGKRHEASLQYATQGDMKKGSMGLPLIPPIRKAVSPVVGSAAGSLHSSLQLDVQESQEMRPGSSSRSKEKDSEHADLTGYPLAKRFSLANPSVLLPSKPLPPIRKSFPTAGPSKICSGEQDSGKNGTGYDDNSRKEQELDSEGKRHEASLQYATQGDMKKGSMGLPLIPPIRKAVSPVVGSAAGSLHSSLQLDVQESQEMRPGSSSRSKEKDSEHAGLTRFIFSKLVRPPPCMLLPSKPLPPIQKSSPASNTIKIFSVEQENGKNDTGDDGRRNKQELCSEGKICKASLQYATQGDMKKGSMGLPLIPPIRKAVSPVVGSAAGSLHSSLQLDVQESQEMRPGSSSRSKEKDSEHAASSESTAQTERMDGKSSGSVIRPGMPLFPRKLAELFSLEPDMRNPGVGNGGLGSRPAQGALAQEPRQRQLSSAAPRVTAREEDKGKGQQGSASHRAGLPVSQAKEMDHPNSPGLMSDKNLRDGFGKIRAALCQLAEKNLEPKDAELFEKEMQKRRQNTTSLQLPPHTVEPRDAAEASFCLPSVNGTASSAQTKHPGSALKKVLRKQDKLPLLPSVPITHEEGIVPCSSSVTSQTAPGAQRREELLRGHGHKDTASPEPQQSLLQALSLLGSHDWEMKEKGLFSIKHLAGSHSQVLLSRRHDICLALTSEVTSLHTKVSYAAIVTLGELFATLKKDMDPEVDEVARVLLRMVWNSPEFVQKAASQTLGIMVENVTPARAMTALLDSGVQSRHVQVRKCAAELLLSLLEKIGVTELAGTARAGRLAHAAGTLAQDCHKDTRHYGQEMVKMLMNHQKCKRLLEQSVSTCDLEDILTRIKKKGKEEQKGERPSVKNPVRKRSNISKKPQATLPSSQRVKSTSYGRLLQRPKAQVMLPPAVDETEQLQKLSNLLEAKGCEARMEGVALLLDLCKNSPQLIATNIVQIFDSFVLRVAESNKKVKQKALNVLAEIIAILKDAMNPVIVLLVEGITKSLNSKDPRVHGAAVNALEESMAHLDKTSLMKEFSYQWNQLGGQALLDVTERITELVEEVYASSPEVVQQCALPVLWACLENKALPVRSANVRTVVTRLASALYEVMDTKLRKCAASQPRHVQDNLSSILGW